MSQLQVLIIPEWYPWPNRPEEGPWAREHALAVAEHNDVVVLACRAGRVPLYAISDQLEDGLRTVRLEYRDTGSVYTSYPIRLVGMLAALRRLRRSGFAPDLAHAHVFYSGFAAQLLLGRRGTPVIVSEHYTAFPRGLVSGVGRVMAKITFERAALVCPVSLDLGRSIRKLGIRGRFAHIPNLVDTHAFSPRPAADPDRLGPVRILNVASLQEKKGHEYLLEAFAAARRKRSDLILDIVGDGPLRLQLEARAAALGVSEAVVFHGFRDKAGVAEFMQRADFLVLSSLFENAPLVLIEAMASGLPCVATRVGGVDEMIDSRRGRLVSAGDSIELAEAILDMSERFRGFSADELAAHALRVYGRDAVTRRWNQAYRDVLTRRGTRRGSTRTREAAATGSHGPA